MSSCRSLAALILVMVLVGACGDDRPPPTPALGPPAATATAPATSVPAPPDVPATPTPTPTPAPLQPVSPALDRDARVAYASGYWPQSDVFVIDAEGTNPRNVTNSPDYNGSQSFAPDGEHILYSVFNYNRYGMGIWVMRADGTEQRSLGDVCGADWLPDGRRIALAQCGTGTLTIVDLSGAVLIELTDLGVGWDMQVSPTGDQVVWSQYVSEAQAEISEIFVAGLDGSPATRLTFGGGRQAVWSPDGTRIAYNGGSDSFAADERARVMRADGSDVVTLPVSEFTVSSHDPSWSPDGQQLVYSVDNMSYPWDIVVANADGTGMQQIAQGDYPRWSPVDERILLYRDDQGQATYVVNADGTDERRIGVLAARVNWSPDGTELLYAADVGGSFFDESGQEPLRHVFVVGQDGSAPLQLTQFDQPDGYPTPMWRRMQWSPDGSLLAVEATTHEHMFQPDLYLVKSDGTSTTRLTTEGGAEPRWSPDGSAILYVEPPPHQGGFPPSHLMYIIQLDTGTVTTLGHGFEPVWSPDGARIAYVGPGPEERSTLTVMRADGSERVALLSDGAARLTWSPDGSRIAFVTERDGNREIYVVNADGTELTNLTQNPNTDDVPAWSPDGSRIAFLSSRGGAHEIWVMGADGSHPTRVTTGTGGTPVWSPRGALLAYTSYHDGELWVVALDGSAPRQLTTKGGQDPAWQPRQQFPPYQGNPFYDTWARTDYPVNTAQVDRTWIWGPWSYLYQRFEPYADSPGGKREVLYLDKARMEVTDPDADPTSPWYVTNGLLVVELVSGSLQLGDAIFEQRDPATLNVAGDPDDPAGPTYATLAPLRAAAPYPAGATLVTRLARDGTLTEDAALASYGVTAGELVNVPGLKHRVASVFWDFMTSSGPVYDPVEGIVTKPLFGDPYFATGYPLTEAYWTTIRVGGQPRDVLVQAFERRVLTYTPGNPPGWQVEAGNVGQHYVMWRYGHAMPGMLPGSVDLDVFIVVLGDRDNLSGGIPGGCGDSLLARGYTTWPAATTDARIAAALEILLGLGGPIVAQSDFPYYNALYPAALTVDSITLDDGVATVELSGELYVSDACDILRAEQQISQTVLAVPGVTEVLIRLNRAPWP